MALIKIDGQTFDSEPDETVLECLERNGCAPASSCKSGVCHTCVMRSVEAPPTHSQGGLKESLQEQNYFLPCICVPKDNMNVTYADATVVPSTSIVLIEKELIAPSILRLRFTVDSDYSYRAGQFTNLFRDEHLMRSYSIASVPDVDEYLEFHIEKIPNGKMSAWLFSDLSIGDEIKISEALGECFYSQSDASSDMLLIATGSGLAPIYGVLRDAINQGHKGGIHIYHGASRLDKLYLVNELHEIADKHENVQYTPALSGEVAQGVAPGRAAELALEQHENLKGWTVYLCGHPEMVSNTKRKVFLAGADLGSILADPFEFI